MLDIELQKLKTEDTKLGSLVQLVEQELLTWMQWK